MWTTVLITFLALCLVYAAMNRSASSRTAMIPVLTGAPAVAGVTLMPEVFAGTAQKSGFVGVPSSAPESITGAFNGIGSVIDGRYYAVHTITTR